MIHRPKVPRQHWICWTQFDDKSDQRRWKHVDGSEKKEDVWRDKCKITKYNVRWWKAFDLSRCRTLWNTCSVSMILLPRYFLVSSALSLSSINIIIIVIIAVACLTLQSQQPRKVARGEARQRVHEQEEEEENRLSFALIKKWRLNMHVCSSSKSKVWERRWAESN